MAMNMEDEKEPLPKPDAKDVEMKPAKPKTDFFAAPAAKKKSIEFQMELPWLEKYRPKTLSDVVGNDQTIRRLKALAQHGNVPNLILVGPPGTGKTTSIHALALELLGEEKYKTAVLELNASDDRGIDVVRNKIKSFAKRKVVLGPGQHKVIILDEADSMTSSSQQALRRTMEIYSSTTRFALACNHSQKIIEPIQSRCAILRYVKLEDKHILKRVKEIMTYEKIVHYTDDGLEAIVFVAGGDMRHALNALQSTFAGFKKVTQDTVFKVCDQPHPKAIRKMLDESIQQNFRTALTILISILDDGFSTMDFIQTMFRVVKGMEMEEGLKLDWIRDMANCHMRIAEGLDTKLQLIGLLSRMNFGQDKSIRDYPLSAKPTVNIAG